MNETRKDLMNQVIRRFGFEDKFTLKFCDMCYQLPNTATDDYYLAYIAGNHLGKPELFKQEKYNAIY